MSRAFNQLKDEGLLTSSWGSTTMLVSKPSANEAIVRGLITLLIPAAAFAGNRQCQSIVARVPNELRKLGFAPRLRFYRGSEVARRDFFENLLKQESDGVVCIVPNSRPLSLVRRLMECGIAVIPIDRKKRPVLFQGGKI